jgi:ABC-type bacteriocin/lantibiotic exporter with double-glycine peptidase domain
LVSLALIARFHGKAAEPKQLKHELGLSAAARAEDLLLAAKQLQLKARVGPVNLTRAASGKLPLPGIVELRPNPSQQDASPVFAVLARVEGARAMQRAMRQG